MDQGKQRSAGAPRVHRVTVVAGEAAEDLPVCWICLDGPALDRPLIHPCRCPSYVHSTCIARWQLQSAGTRRERYCDFCASELPDWKGVLTPSPGATAPAVMNVNFDNKTYSFHVAPGADGYRQFTEAIRKAFHLPDDSELNITFTCDEPSSAGSLLTLSGPGAYDAAVHCASVSAARRSLSGSEGHGPSQQAQAQPDSGDDDDAASPAQPFPLPPALWQDDADAQRARDQGPQQQQLARHAGSDDGGEQPQEPPTTPRLGGGQQQLPLPPRPASASSQASSASSHGGASSSGRSLGSVERLLLHDEHEGGGRASGAGERPLARTSASSNASASSTSSAAAPGRASPPLLLRLPFAAAGPSGAAGELERRSGGRGASSSLSSASSSSGSSSSGGSTAGGGVTRRSSGLGRKLREALADLLINK